MKMRSLAGKAVTLALFCVWLPGCGSDRDGDRGAERQSTEAREEAAKLGLDPASVTPEDLRSAVSDEAARKFYEARNWQPAWTTESASGLLEQLANTSAHGLPRDMFLAETLEGSPANREAALTVAALSYAKALAQGVADPAELREIYTVPRPKVDVAGGLARAIEANQVGQWIGSLAPQTDEYRAMSEAFRRYAREAASGGDRTIESGDLIRPGDTDPRVPRLAEALQENGYLSAAGGQEQAPQSGTAQQPGQYTPAMAEAVKRMQNDYGISSDGIVGPETLEVLNTGSADRARQLAINLERLRWLERNPPATRIDVNTAAAHLDYWRDGQHRDQRRVVVGQPDWETPQLGSPIYRLVANPTWTVPRSIEEEEIAGRGAAYLRRNNMVRRDGWIVQLPGPENALGQVKFDMQNDQSIYLHDTPAKSLFAQNERHRSHGCIRVQDALGFAHMLARDDGILPKFEQALATGEETFVPMRSNIPVRLLYHTAFVDNGGQVRFRTDAYGWDDDVAAAIGRERREARRVQSHTSDIGP